MTTTRQESLASYCPRCQHSLSDGETSTVLPSYSSCQLPSPSVASKRREKAQADILRARQDTLTWLEFLKRAIVDYMDDPGRCWDREKIYINGCEQPGFLSLEPPPHPLDRLITTAVRELDGACKERIRYKRPIEDAEAMENFNGTTFK